MQGVFTRLTITVTELFVSVLKSAFQSQHVWGISRKSSEQMTQHSRFSMVLVVALKFSPSLLFSVLRLFPFNDVKQFSVLCIVRIKLCALFSPMWGVVGLCCYSRRVRAKDDLQ